MWCAAAYRVPGERRGMPAYLCPERTRRQDPRLDRSPQNNPMYVHTHKYTSVGEIEKLTRGVCKSDGGAGVRFSN